MRTLSTSWSRIVWIAHYNSPRSLREHFLKLLGISRMILPTTYVWTSKPIKSPNKYAIELVSWLIDVVRLMSWLNLEPMIYQSVSRIGNPSQDFERWSNEYPSTYRTSRYFCPLSDTSRTSSSYIELLFYCNDILLWGFGSFKWFLNQRTTSSLLSFWICY